MIIECQYVYVYSSSDYCDEPALTSDSCVAISLKTNAAIAFRNAEQVILAEVQRLLLGQPIWKPSAQEEQKRSEVYGWNVLDPILIKQMGNDYLLSGTNQRLYMCSETVK